MGLHGLVFVTVGLIVASMSYFLDIPVFFYAGLAFIAYGGVKWWIVRPKKNESLPVPPRFQPGPYCANCGSIVSQYAQFCSKCGNRV